jgi:MFS superfamily sulfate permease-like transporter
VGLICVAPGLARLGFVTELLSKPIRPGCMNGIALAVLASRLSKLCGLSAEPGPPPVQLLGWIEDMAAGHWNSAALGIGLLALAIILLLKRWPRWPGMLLAIAAATLCVVLFGMDQRHGVRVLGSLPQGLPALNWPAAGFGDLGPVLVGALAVAALLLVAPQLLERLPDSALAAVVTASVIGLIEWRDLQRIRRIQAWKFWLSIACTLGVLWLGAIQGIALAIVIAVIEFLWDGWRRHWVVLGQVEGIDGFHDVRRHPEAQRIEGLVLLRWDAPLFFANAEWFERVVREVIGAAPSPVRWLVVTAEPVTSVDITAADMLAEPDRALEAQGIELCFAEMKGPVKDKLKRFGLFERFGHQTFFATIDEAVRAHRARHPGG